MNEQSQGSKHDALLLREWAPFKYDREELIESRKRGGPLIMSGILQKADVLNQNGRIYPRAILAREVENYQRFILENRALGELDHPAHAVVELQNVSHVIRSAKMDSNGVVTGTIEVLDTPKGRILSSLVEANITIGISSRGVGSTKNEGGRAIVQDDFQLICWDIVSEPSTPNAFIMREIREPRRLTSMELTELSKQRRGASQTDRLKKIDRIASDILLWRTKR